MEYECIILMTMFIALNEFPFRVKLNKLILNIHLSIENNNTNITSDISLL